MPIKNSTINSLIYLLIYVGAGHGMHVENLGELVLSFHHVGSRDRTQIVR